MRYDLPDDFLVDDGLHSHPVVLGQRRNGRIAESGEGVEEILKFCPREVHLEADLVAGREGADQKEGDPLHLAALPGVGAGGLVGHEDRVGLDDGLEDAELVGAEGGAGLGDVDDGVDQIGNLHLGGSPGEFDVGRDPIALEVTAGQTDRLGGDALPLEILDRLVG